MSTDAFFMGLALEQATLAAQAGEVPVGAVVVRDGRCIATGRNRTLETGDPSAHAEVLALREAARVLGSHRLQGASLYVTLEPCPMCAGMIFHSRLARLVFGTTDPKTGCAGSVLDLFAVPALNHHTQVHQGVLATQCGQQLQQFFQARRQEHAAQHIALREDALRTPLALGSTGLADFAQSACWCTVSEGWRLHCIDARPDAAIAAPAMVDTHTAVLCLHDFPYWAHQFAPLLPALVALGYRVLAPDLLGCGNSDKPKKTTWHNAQAHASVLQQCLQQLGVSRCVLLSVGRAGAVGAALAARSPGLVRARILLAQPDDPPQPNPSSQRSATVARRAAQMALPPGASAAVWTRARQSYLQGLSPVEQQALCAPFADAGHAAIFAGMEHASFGQSACAQATVRRVPVDGQHTGCATLRFSAALCQQVLAVLQDEMEALEALSAEHAASDAAR